MSDDEADPELLALLRESLGLNGTTSSRPLETRVLENAEYVYDNSVDVALDMHSTKAAASAIWNMMQEKDYSCKTWSEHELHPQAKDESTVNFIFIMDLLNFCFWSDTQDPGSEFFVDFRQKRWTGYWSLVASLQRALDEGIPITSPVFWSDESSTDDELRHVFRSASSEPMPMLEDRISCIREAGRILNKVTFPNPRPKQEKKKNKIKALTPNQEFHSSFLTCIEEANGSAAALVNLLVDNFPCFRDTTRFEGKTIRFYKRAQILVADLWACFEGTSYGRFDDIDSITMFADYRIPQMLNTLGVLQYSPPLESHIRRRKRIASGHAWEVQLRGCSIWAVELLRREIRLHHQQQQEQQPQKEKARPVNVNAILIDFFLYDTIKDREAKADSLIPHHRT
ncbi:MAG: hypothetical protein Q9191_000781, partial [Dirinaria sp. TL-2023a]